MAAGAVALLMTPGADPAPARSGAPADAQGGD
jgi:hypothetical protein